MGVRGRRVKDKVERLEHLLSKSIAYSEFLADKIKKEGEGLEFKCRLEDEMEEGEDSRIADDGDDEDREDDEARRKRSKSYNKPINFTAAGAAPTEGNSAAAAALKLQKSGQRAARKAALCVCCGRSYS